jgi:hypothetical protein
MTELGVDNTPPDKTRWCERFMDGTIVAEIEPSDGHLPRTVGYAFYAQNDTDVYVRNVVCDPAFRRHGVGRALLTWIAKETRARGAATWRLNVKPDNLPALGLYQSLGMRKAHASAAVRVELEVCAKLRVKRSIRESRDRAEWSQIESEHAMPSGTLSERADQGDRVLVVRHKRGPCSVAVFDPSFPGAFIFKPTTPQDGEALLREMAGHCEPRQGVLQVVVENDEATIAHLVDRGAYVQMRFVHYAGLLPA